MEFAVSDVAHTAKLKRSANNLSGGLQLSRVHADAAVHTPRLAFRRNDVVNQCLEFGGRIINLTDTSEPPSVIGLLASVDVKQQKSINHQSSRAV